MSKRGILVVILLLILSVNSVYALSRLSIPLQAEAGSNIIISINPASSGIYKELYITNTKGNIVDTITLDCEKICYDHQEITYVIPSNLSGSYKLYVYDYSINDYIFSDLKITQSKLGSVIQEEPEERIDKYLFLSSILYDGKNPVTLKLRNISSFLNDIERFVVSSYEDSISILPPDNSMLLISNIDDGLPRIDIIEYTDRYIVELNDKPLAEYETILKNEIKNYDLKINSLEDIKGKRNIILNLINEIKLTYFNYKLDRSRSKFNARLVSHNARLISSHDKVKSRIKDNLPDAEILGEVDKVFNGILVKSQSPNSIRKIRGVKEVHKDNIVRPLLNTSVSLINADDIWSRGYTGVGVKIAILDTGVDYTHPALGGCFGPGCKVEAGVDFVSGDNDPMDVGGHGTHVASIAAGNGLVKGVAPDAKIYAYRVMDPSGGSTFSIVLGIERAIDPNNDKNFTDHVDIMSLSLGGSGNPDDSLSTALDNAVNLGVVTVVAAGNAGRERAILSPGTSRKAITVGASTKEDRLAYFSSGGPVINGYEVLIKPEILAPGYLICAAQWDNLFPGARCFDRHINQSGTSMAAPHIAGVAALLKQANPSWTPEMIKTALLITAKDLGYSPFWQGFGRVDAFQAFNTSIYVDKPIIYFGNTPINSEQTFKITNIRDYPISLTLTPGKTRKKDTNDIFDSISLNTTNLLLEPGENEAVKAILSIPQLGGIFYGQIIIDENGRKYKMLYSYTNMAILNVRVKSTLVDGFLRPNIFVVDDNMLELYASFSFESSRSDSTTFLVYGGANYTVYAIGDGVEDIEYILMSRVQVPIASSVDDILSTDNARAYRFNGKSNNGIPLLMAKLSKGIHLSTSSRRFTTLLDSAQHRGKRGDRLIYMTNTPINKNMDTDVIIYHNGFIPKNLGDTGIQDKTDQSQKLNFIVETDTTSSEEYYLNWYLWEVNSSVTSFDYSLADLAIYNATYDYPSVDPESYISEIDYNPPYFSDFFSIPKARKYAVPLNRAYYIKPIDSGSFSSNTSFLQTLYINYLKSSNKNVSAAYTAMFKESHKRLYPFAGHRDITHFGRVPLRPAQMIVQEDKVKLDDALVRGFSRKTTLSKKEFLNTFPVRYLVTINKPTYSIYLDSNLVKSGNLTIDRFGLGKEEWDSSRLNYSLAPGINLINITIPIEYLVWNKTILTVQINYPSSDVHPPVINSVSMSPRFKANSNLTIIANITDNIFLSSVNISYRYRQDWNQMTMANTGDIYVAELPSVLSGENKVDVKISASDTSGNINEMQILPASLPERTINIIPSINNTQPLPGQAIKLYGRCLDNTGRNCTNLRVIYSINGIPIYIDKTYPPSFLYPGGWFSFEWVTQPFLSILQFRTIFEGTGLYRSMQGVYGIISQDLRRDLGITDLSIPTLVFNKPNKINFTLYNDGSDNEYNITVKILINSKLQASKIIPVLNPNTQLTVSMDIIPGFRGLSQLSLFIDDTDENMANNKIDSIVNIDYLLPVLYLSPLTSPSYLIGSIANKTTTITNIGKLDAENVQLTEYIVHGENLSYQRFIISYNNITNVSINGTSYLVTAYQINSTHNTFYINGNSISENITLFNGEITSISDGTLIDTPQVPTFSVAEFTLTKNYDVRNTNISIIPAKDTLILYDSIPVNSLAKYRVKGIVFYYSGNFKGHNIYELFFFSYANQPDLAPSFTAPLVRYYIRFNKTSNFNINLRNNGGNSTDASIRLLSNTTEANYSFIGLIPAQSSVFRSFRYKPNLTGLMNITVIANTSDELNPSDNIATRQHISVRTRNITFTTLNSTNHNPIIQVIYPFAGPLGFKSVSLGTILELPDSYPFPLSIRKTKITVITPIFVNSVIFRVDYKGTLAKDNMSIFTEYYENIQNDNLLLHFTFANIPDWQYNSMDYSIRVSNPLSDPSSSYTYGCQDWDFTNKICLTQWTRLTGLRQISSTLVYLNGSSPNVEALALATDTSQPTTTIFTASGGGSSGGGSIGYNLDQYTELMYYKLINPNNPFNAFTKNQLLDIVSIGFSATEEYKNDYIKVTEYFYPQAGIQPATRFIYSFFDIEHLQIPIASIQQANITFRLPIDWLATYSILPDNIVMQRYSGSLWQDLKTKVSYVDDAYYYFTAEAPSLSTFAITYNPPEQELQQPATTSIVQQQQPAQPEQQSYSRLNMIFIVVPVAMLITAIILLFIRKKKTKQPFSALYAAIIKAKKQGFKDEEIAKTAREQGWPEDIINDALAILNKPKS